MEFHYDSNAGENANRKSVTSFAKKIEAENAGGVNQKFFKTRFVHDNYHTLSFFKKVCKAIGNVKSKEYAEMQERLLATEGGKNHQFGELYAFSDEELYEALISNEICKRVCDKQKYENWQDIVFRFM